MIFRDSYHVLDENVTGLTESGYYAVGGGIAVVSFDGANSVYRGRRSIRPPVTTWNFDSQHYLTNVVDRGEFRDTQRIFG